MNNEIEVPVISYEEIRKRADTFLMQYHPSRKIPVPVEEIAEFQMGINIIPLPGLRNILEVDGFTTSDLSNIFVDEFMYNSRPERYRFTLAHEIGHIVLHKKIYQEANFKNSQEWKDFINSISDQQHRWLEYQAYAFGGLILVPKEHLKRLTDHYIKQVMAEGIKNWDYIWEYISAQLAKDFAVSTQVIEKRLTKEELRELYR